MSALENLCAFWPKYFHEEKNEVSDVALYELVYEAGPIYLIQDGVNLVRLWANVLKNVVYFGGVEHCFYLFY